MHICSVGLDAGSESVRGSRERACGTLDKRTAQGVGNALKTGKKKGDSGTGSWAKTKFDHQIVAIGKVEGADTIYTDDKDLGKVAAKLGLKVVTLADLPLPPSKTPLFDNLPPDNP